MSKYFKKTLTIFLSSILLLLIVTVSILWGFSNDLPDYKFLKNYKAPVSSKVYSGDGDLIQDFSSEKRIFVPYSAIPNRIINSFLIESTFISPAPTTQHIPHPLATKAACEVIPPREVRIATDALIPSTSSGFVSSLTSTTFSPLAAQSTAS